MAQQKNIPQIRFKGFTQEWKASKLGDIATETNGGGTPNTSVKKYWNGTIPWIQSSDLNEDRVSGVLPRKFISKEGLCNSATKLISKNSIAIVTRVGVGKLAVMPFSYATSQDFLSLSKLNTNVLFSVYTIYRILQKELSIVQGTSIKGITKEELLSKSIFVPSLVVEQSKLGTLFSLLDQLITLKQQKYNKLVTVKKAMLEKMFPQNGATVPQIRFKGFTEEWEEKKLGDESIEIIAGGDIDKSKIVDSGKYPVLANALTNDGILGYYENSFRVKAPALTVTGRGDVGHAKVRNTHFTPVVRLLSIKTKHDVYFLENVINNHEVLVESTGVPQLTTPQLSNYQIYLPKTENEEKIIGMYFKRLDNLIDLQQRELEKLKQVKKGCLEKMFV